MICHLYYIKHFLKPLKQNVIKDSSKELVHWIGYLNLVLNLVYNLQLLVATSEAVTNMLALVFSLD